MTWRILLWIYALICVIGLVILLTGCTTKGDGFQPDQIGWINKNLKKEINVRPSEFPHYRH